MDCWRKCVMAMAFEVSEGEARPSISACNDPDVEPSATFFFPVCCNVFCYDDNGINLQNCKPVLIRLFFIKISVVIVSLQTNKNLTKTHLPPDNNSYTKLKHQLQCA